MPTSASSASPCPNCQQAMHAQDLERHDHGTVSVYSCYACSGFWFDHMASVQLAPTAVVELFREIYAHRDDVRLPMAAALRCPRCRDALTRSFDLSKSGRFSYFMCQRGDGRFTPFFQFLREKQFVRNLTLAELQRIRSMVKQITCSQCGAPIDLEHDSQCKYCHAPVSFLDPDAVEKAARIWSATRDPPSAAVRREPTAEALSRALLHSEPRAVDVPLEAADLVSWGIHAIGRLFSDHG